MRNLTKTALALGLAACLAPAAQAQGQRGGGMMGGGAGINLLRNPAVQKELKLTDEQIEKATKASEEMREKMMDRREELQGLEGEEMREKMQAMQKEMAADSKKMTDAMLKPEQAKRLDQISLQQRGFMAFSDPDIQSKLKMTDEQKGKVKEMGDDMQEQMRDLFSPGGDRAEGMRKMQAMQKEMKEKAATLMSEEQKKAWMDMTGDPFEVPMGQGGGRRGAGNR